MPTFLVEYCRQPYAHNPTCVMRVEAATRVDAWKTAFLALLGRGEDVEGGRVWDGTRYYRLGVLGTGTDASGRFLEPDEAAGLEAWLRENRLDRDGRVGIRRVAEVTVPAAPGRVLDG